MILSSRNKISLSRTLRARTTPYPRASRFFKHFIIMVIIAVLAGVIVIAKPLGKKTTEPASSEPKQILGVEESKVEYMIYEVKKGDTLFNLSNKYGVSWETLGELNNLKEPFILKIGMKLKIPSPQ